MAQTVDPLANPKKVILSPNEKISRGISRFQKKVHDINVRMQGQRLVLLRLEYIEDKFFNYSQELMAQMVVYGIVNFPNQEIPMNFLSSTNNNTTSGNLLHAYDLLPITFIPRFLDKVKGKDIILLKIKMPDDSFDVLPLQVNDMISKATISNVVNIEYEVAPPTDSVLLGDPKYIKILNYFKTSDLW